MLDYGKVAMSTCWCSHRHIDGYEMLKELAELGFEQVELSHGIRLPLVPGILRAVDEGWIQVSSLHNFCPLPAGVKGAAPNLYEPTADSKQERQHWYRQTIKTLDFAARVGAPVVILHAGSVSYLFGNPETRLKRALATKDADAISGQVTEVLQSLEARQEKYVGRLMEGLSSLVPQAALRGVRLAIENREGLLELPMEKHMAQLLRELNHPEWIGYWHDTGHAHLKEKLGVFAQQDLLAQNSSRQFGFHLHDVSVNGKDHQTPGTGVIDWDKLRRFVRPQHTLTMELSPRLARSQVLAGKTFLDNWLSQSARSQALATASLQVVAH